MPDLENRVIANPDEKRVVGHFQLRTAALAPNPEIEGETQKSHAATTAFAGEVHAAKIHGSRGVSRNLCHTGIDCSQIALQFLAKALSSRHKEKSTPFYLDNADLYGNDNVLSYINSSLGVTMCVVVSKSEGTKETYNGMLEPESGYRRAGIEFFGHAVAATNLDRALRATR